MPEFLFELNNTEIIAEMAYFLPHCIEATYLWIDFKNQGDATISQFISKGA